MNGYKINGVGCCMSKICIFNEKRVCINCGECEICELNSNKKCNNCGECLELEGYDVKAIKIDEVFEDKTLEKLEENVNDKNKIDLTEDLIKLQSENEIQDEIEVEDQLEELESIDEYDLLTAEDEFLKLNNDGFIPENNEVWEYIDDIDGARELLEEDNTGLLHEEFPGLIVLKKI
jgi:hypothetical protein